MEISFALINGTANAITGSHDITRAIGGRLAVLHRFTAGYIRLHSLPEAWQNSPPLRAETCVFSRLTARLDTALCSNTLLLLAMELSRARSHHSNRGQRTKALHIKGIKATRALSFFLR